MDEKKITEKVERVIAVVKKINASEKFWAIISYIGIFSLIPLVLKVKGDYARFHLKQGVVLFVSEIIFTLIWVIPVVGWIIGFLGWIVCAVLSVVGIVNASAGREWRMPILDKFAEKIRI